VVGSAHHGETKGKKTFASLFLWWARPTMWKQKEKKLSHRFSQGDGRPKVFFGKKGTRGHCRVARVQRRETFFGRTLSQRTQEKNCSMAGLMQIELEKRGCPKKSGDGALFLCVLASSPRVLSVSLFFACCSLVFSLMERANGTRPSLRRPGLRKKARCALVVCGALEKKRRRKESTPPCADASSLVCVGAPLPLLLQAQRWCALHNGGAISTR